MSLSRLTINNIVLIDKLTIDFAEGLGTLTGETGAGKSILLDSLGLALGARSDSGLLRHGEEKASVIAEFDIPPVHALYQYIADQDLDLDITAGEPIILRRSLASDGRSRAHINDQPISIKMLQNIGAMLVEIHGQFDTHGLMDPANHAALLDEYANLKAPLAAPWKALKDAQKKLRDMKEQIEQSRRDEDYLRAAIETLDALAPEDGEEETLSTLRDQLMHRERVLEGLNAAYHALSQDQDPVAAAAGAIDRITDKIGDQGDEILAALDRAACEIQEACNQIQSLSADLAESDHNLETIDERLYALRREARKHNCDVDDLAAKREELAEKLNAIEYAEDLLTDQAAREKQARQEYLNIAKEVSAARKTAAADLDTKVAKELDPLKLGKAKFKTDVSDLPENQWGENGIDAVQFLVATNPGQAPGALSKIASGGEMSRFMLALKVVMAATGTAQTLIFDEVDAGIGGSTADAVGQRLALLAKQRQVLVVTHAPQVAARAAHHYIVQKNDENGATRTHIDSLRTETDRAEEIARMLAGETITPEARAAAQKLLENAA